MLNLVFPQGVLAATCRRTLLCLLCMACSPETNPWAYTSPASHAASFDVQVARARAYFDTEEYEQAHHYAKLAHAANPQSEEAAILLGYTYLALAGITPFGLAEVMMGNKDGDKKESKKEEQSASTEPQESGSGGALGSLGEVVGLTAEEFARLGTLNTADPILPVIEPLCADQARANVDKLGYVNAAITTVCPFVDPEVLIAGEHRHNCPQRTPRRARRPQAHFLWAFAHLVEAVAFNKVINYNTTGDKKSNLELRADAVQALGVSAGEDFSKINDFIAAMDDFSVTIERVLQVAGVCSPADPQTQLTALVNDLYSVSNGFGRMDGVSPKMTASIDKAIARLRSLEEKAQGDTQQEAKTGAIKSDLTQTMAKSLGAAIASIDPESYSPQQIEDVCNSYGQISGNLEDDANRPVLCGGMPPLDEGLPGQGDLPLPEIPADGDLPTGLPPLPAFVKDPLKG